MIEVFKTNVQEVDELKQIIQKLIGHFSEAKINFDLDDCDKILRIETTFIENENVTFILNSMGYQCEVLPD